MKNSKLILTGILCLLISGCATIFKGGSADIKVNSSPSGAEIYLNDINRGSTPQTLSLKRNKDYVLTFKREGYEDTKLEVTKKFDVGTTVVGNIFSWSLLGVVVDIASGAAYSLEPYNLQANMEALRTAGYLPKNFKPKKDEVHVIMLTTEQWEALQSQE